MTFLCIFFLKVCIPVYVYIHIYTKKKVLYYSKKILHVNNTLFDLSVQLDLTLEFTMFQILEHFACLPTLI